MFYEEKEMSLEESYQQEVSARSERAEKLALGLTQGISETDPSFWEEVIGYIADYAGINFVILPQGEPEEF